VVNSKEEQNANERRTNDAKLPIVTTFFQLMDRKICLKLLKLK